MGTGGTEEQPCGLKSSVEEFTWNMKGLICAIVRFTNTAMNCRVPYKQDQLNSLGKLRKSDQRVNRTSFKKNHPVSVVGGAVTAAVICSVPLDHKQRDAWTKERV
jgi:hypothetical protein